MTKTASDPALRRSVGYFFRFPPLPFPPLAPLVDSLTVVEGLRLTVLCLTNFPVFADLPLGIFQLLPH
jgi:hypothetical protein